MPLACLTLTGRRATLRVLAPPGALAEAAACWHHWPTMRLDALFSTANRTRSQAARERFARFELLRSAAQFLAALCFLGGSVVAVVREPAGVSSWLYIIGSLLFCAAPSVRLWSEVTLYRMGYTDTLAERSSKLAPSQFERGRRRRRKRRDNTEGS